jgi:hypothetical protein
LNKRHASPLKNMFPRWIRRGIISCACPTCRTCAGWSLQDSLFRKILQHNEVTNVHKGREGQMFQQHSASDINLRGILFMLRTLFGIATTAVAVARVPSVRLAGIIFVIFRRGFWRCNTLSSPLLF